MKKLFVLPVLMFGLVYADTVAAQNLTPREKDLIRGIEQSVQKQFPVQCLNGYCFSGKSQALAYCQGLAEAVSSAQFIPWQAENTLKDTLARCRALLQNTPKECASSADLAQAREKGKKTFLELLGQANQAMAQGYTQLSYVDGYRQIGQGIQQGARRAAEIYRQGYQHMAKGYQQVNYVDGYRQIGQALSDTYEAGYQHMARGYSNLDYVDGYRQIGQGIKQGAQKAAKVYKQGYQHMAEGYTKVSYTDGYRQIWQAIKNFFQEGCRTKVKADLILWEEFNKAHSR